MKTTIRENKIKGMRKPTKEMVLYLASYYTRRIHTKGISEQKEFWDGYYLLKKEERHARHLRKFGKSLKNLSEESLIRLREIHNELGQGKTVASTHKVLTEQTPKVEIQIGGIIG